MICILVCTGCDVGLEDVEAPRSGRILVGRAFIRSARPVSSLLHLFAKEALLCPCDVENWERSEEDLWLGFGKVTSRLVPPRSVEEEAVHILTFLGRSFHLRDGLTLRLEVCR